VQNLNQDLFHLKFYARLRKSPVFTSEVIDNCQFFVEGIIIYFQVTGTPLRRVIIAMAANDEINVNFGFKQFVTHWACSNKSFMTIDNISIMCRNLC